jgi:hypothetical protein
MINYTSDQSQIEHINLTNNQVSHTQQLNQGKNLGNQIHQLPCQKYNGTAPSRAMGKRRRNGKYFPQKKKIIQYRIQ